MKHIALIGLISALCSIAVPAQAADAPQAHKNNPFAGVRTTDTTNIPVQIGNYNYEIPANYFDTPPHLDCNAEAALLVAVLPDVKGRSEENSREIDLVAGQDAKRLTILLETDRKRRDNAQERLQSWANVVEENFGPTQKAEYPWYGLEYHYYSEALNKRGSAKDQYRFYQNGKLASQIECSIIGSVPSPMCNHSFILNDMTVKLVYPLSRLSQWRTIEDKVIKLVSSWNVEHSKKLKRICKE